MKMFEIERCETIAKIYYIEAKTAEEAEEKLLSRIENGEIEPPKLSDCIETWISSARELTKGEVA